MTGPRGAILSSSRAAEWLSPPPTPSADRPSSLGGEAAAMGTLESELGPEQATTATRNGMTRCSGRNDMASERIVDRACGAAKAGGFGRLRRSGSRQILLTRIET